nr:lipid II flippase MurJ [Rhodocyclus purpureus]
MPAPLLIFYGEAVASTLRKDLAWSLGLYGLSFLASFASLFFISYHFGASAELDAYWGAFALMNLLAFPLAPLREGLVPELHRRLQQGREAASAYFSPAMTLILLVASVGGLVGWWLAEPLTVLAVSESQLRVRTLVVGQLYWLAPAVLLLAVSETLNAILAAYDRLVLQSLARLLGAASTLTVLALFANFLQSHVLPLSFIAAQVTTVLVQIVALRSHGLTFKLSWPRALGERFFAVSGALLATYAASQAYAVFEKHTLITFVAGLVSSFQYAVSLTNVLITLVGVVLANVFWPRFMAQVAAEDRNSLYADLSTLSQFTFLVLGCLCALTWLNSTALITLIFARGAFDASAVTLTSDALRMAVFAAVPISINMIMGRALISIGAARGIVVAGFTTTFVGTTILAMGQFLNSPALALSHWLLANSAGLAIQAIFLARACGHFAGAPGRALWWLSRWFVALALSGITTQAIPVAQHGMIALVADIAMRALVFSALFGAFAWIFGLMRGLPPFFRR